MGIMKRNNNIISKAENFVLFLLLIIYIIGRNDNIFIGCCMALFLSYMYINKVCIFLLVEYVLWFCRGIVHLITFYLQIILNENKSAMIKLIRISRLFYTDDVETQVINDLSLTINRRELVSIMGLWDCGKSTLFNIMGLLDSLISREIKIDGIIVCGMSDKELAHLMKI